MDKTAAELVVTAVSFGIVMGVIYIIIPFVVARQAKRRGYSFWVWFVAAFVGNSIILLILLGVMPDQARKRRRKKEMADLETRLQDAVGQVVAIEPPRDIFRSVGDGPTVLPARSMGDDETRL